MREADEHPHLQACLLLEEIFSFSSWFFLYKDNDDDDEGKRMWPLLLFPVCISSLRLQYTFNCLSLDPKWTSVISFLPIFSFFFLLFRTRMRWEEVIEGESEAILQKSCWKDRREMPVKKTRIRKKKRQDKEAGHQFCQNEQRMESKLGMRRDAVSFIVFCLFHWSKF